MNSKISVMINTDTYNLVKNLLVQKHGEFPDINQFTDFVINNIVFNNYEEHINTFNKTGDMNERNERPGL